MSSYFKMEKGSEEYQLLCERNNNSAKKSRDKSKVRFDEMEKKILALETEKKTPLNIVYMLRYQLKLLTTVIGNFGNPVVDDVK
jgi:hypothetical protein